MYERGKIMRRIILASHGSLAEGLHSAAKMIAGQCETVSAYGMDQHGGPENIRKKIKEQIEQHEEDEFIILCDIKGGSVHNQLYLLCTRKNVTVLTGVNLGMLLNLVMASDTEKTAEIIAETVDMAKDSIGIFNYETLQAQLKQVGEEM